MNKKRSTPPNPAAAAREAAQRKARDERQQNRGSPEHRHLPEGVPYRDPVSPLEEQFNPMHQGERQDPYREHLLEGAYAQGILGSVASHPLPFFVQPPLQQQQGWEEWTFFFIHPVSVGEK